MRRSLLCVLLLFGIVGTVLGRAAVRNPQGRLPLGGLWKGKLPVLGGNLDLTISVIPLAGGKYFAALDVPAQKMTRVPTEVTVRGDSVLLAMPGVGSRYAARFD